MKIIHISHSDICGGAARAAYRLHRGLLSRNIDSSMLVRVKKSDDCTVIGPTSKSNQILNLARASLGSRFDKLQSTPNVNMHSGNWLPSDFAKMINASNADVVNLHWVNGETISIEDIAKINKPIVWTLHDMWPFCGAEHYTNDDENARWRLGYGKQNRLIGETGLDIDRLVWQRKRARWNNKKFHIISPSQWLADCARDSVLFENMPITTIPNVLDTHIYKPLDKVFCRRALGLPQDKKIILFGAMGGSKDPRKGYDLLLAALNLACERGVPDDVMCVVFGQSEPKNGPKLPFSTKWLGHIHDDVTLALIYNAATVMVVPSRQDNLPQTATEPQACGTPVVAFNCSGLVDIVDHTKTGYLAQSFDISDLADGIQSVLSSESYYTATIKASLNKWSSSVVVNKYIQVYYNALKSLHI